MYIYPDKLKLLLENLLESGKTVICLDPEHELEDISRNLSGCFIDLMSGRYIINPLEPKLWDVDGEDDPDAPEAFRKHSRLSQHISFLKDFFRAYKDFTQWHIDTIELMLERLYKKWGIPRIRMALQKLLCRVVVRKDMKNTVILRSTRPARLTMH